MAYVQNGNGTTGFPVWARLAAYLGFPVLVAAFYLGQSAGYVPSRFSDTQEKILANQVATNNSLLEHRQRQEDLLYTLGVAIRVLCENGAKTREEKANCATILTLSRRHVGDSP